VIELVVLDIAGTTVCDEDAVATCLGAALSGAGVDVSPAAINAVMGLPKPEAIRRLIAARPGAPDCPPDVDAVHGDFVARMIEHYRTAPQIAPVDGATAVFRRLRAAGLRVALNTGFNRVITAALLDRLNWRDGDAIDTSICSDEVSRGRPYPDMIHALMQRCGVRAAERVAKVGDTPADLGEGTAAGCRLVIGVTSGTHTAIQLAPHAHTHLVESVRDVPALCIPGG